MSEPTSNSTTPRRGKREACHRHLSSARIGISSCSAGLCWRYCPRRLRSREYGRDTLLRHLTPAMAGIAIWLCALDVSLSSALVAGGCGSRCQYAQDCAGELTCRFGECSADDPALATQCVGDSSCKPFKSEVTSKCGDCCVNGQNYNYYNCSPALAAANKAWLYQATFKGGMAACTSKYYENNASVVSMSTGWFNGRKSCLQPIRIVANNRSVVATVVDECGSYFGCKVNINEDTAAFGNNTPCRYDAVAGTDAVWQALGVPPDSDQYGGMYITWSFVNLPNPPNPPAGHEVDGSSRRRIVAIACGTAGAIVALLLLLLLGVAKRYYSSKQASSSRSDLSWNRHHVYASSLPPPQQFEFRQLAKATNNFSQKLGEGGFGSVFMGTLSDGSSIAVKRMEGSGHGEKQFKAEVMSIGSIHHMNLIRLRGYCIDSSTSCFLVYEYMPNGSLDKWIFKHNQQQKGGAGEEEERLDWSTRFAVCLDIARGLCYLHEGCSERVLHLDIKPQNILLDEQLRAKISDFGLAKLMGRDASSVVTVMRGTPGYMAPEWLQLSVTDRTDIYSFGVVLLEIVMCRRGFIVPADSAVDTSGSNFWLLRLEALQMLGEEEIVCDDSIIAQVERVIRTAVWCTQDEPSARPSIGSVVKMLEGEVGVDEPPQWTKMATRSAMPDLPH